MFEQNLKQKAVSGVLWTSIQMFAGIGMSFISGIILARLLTPFDYGCIGMLSIFMGLAGVFTDGGFGSALIQKKQPTQTDYSTIFFWNMGVSVLVYVILFVCAPSIARFYKIPLLSSVLRVEGLVLIINAFNVIQNSQLRKKLDFRAISIVTLFTSIIALGTAIWMAHKGFGVWALVALYLISAAIPTAVFWFYVKWRPTWTFSWQSFNGLFGFGFFIFLTNLINSFGQRIQGLLIGKVYNPTTMGYYSKAESTEQLASTSISGIMTQVTYPLYAEVQDDKEALSNMIRRLTMTLAYITFPLMFVLLLCAKPVFVLLYSDRWLQSVPYFQMLCFAGLAGCLQAVNYQAISAIGKSKTMFVWTLLKRVVGIIAVVSGLLFYGIRGLLVGVIINYWFSYFVNISLVSKHIGYKVWRQVCDLLPVAITSLIAAAVSYVASCSLHWSMYPDGMLRFFVYLLIYLGWSFIVRPEAYTYFLTVIPEKFRFWERKKSSDGR